MCKKAYRIYLEWKSEDVAYYDFHGEKMAGNQVPCIIILGRGNCVRAELRQSGRLANRRLFGYLQLRSSS
jgi:hypothetical protein